MKLKFLSIVAIALLFMVNVSQAQDLADKPFRIGIKLGVPNLAGLSFEYVAPILKGRLSAAFDYSYIPYSIDAQTDLKFKYWSLGANYYFLKPGKGLYAGISTGNANLKASVTQTDPSTGLTGSGETNPKVGYPVMLKIGVKVGGRVYFRTEVGYAMVNMPSTIEVVIKYPPNNPPIPNETKTFDIPPVDFPFVFNIGFGIAF